jgi:hypothetical protein
MVWSVCSDLLLVAAATINRLTDNNAAATVIATSGAVAVGGQSGIGVARA